MNRHSFLASLHRENPMNHGRIRHFTRPFAIALLAACVLAPHAAHAQQATRRVVAEGEVSGLELALEGTQHTVRGARARYLLLSLIHI